MIYFSRVNWVPLLTIYQKSTYSNFTFKIQTYLLLIGGGGGGAEVVLIAHDLLLPGLVVPGVEVEVELPPGVHHQLAGTEGTDLVVGQSCLGHQVGLPVEAPHLVQLCLVLSLPLPE